MGKPAIFLGCHDTDWFFLNTDSTSDPVDEVTDEKASYLFGLSWYRLFFLNTDSTSDPVDEYRWESQLSFWVVMIQIVFFKYGLNIWSCWWTQMGKPAIFLGCHDTGCFFLIRTQHLILLMNTDGKASYFFGLSWYRLFFLNTDSTSDPVDEHRWESQLSFWVVTIQIVFFKYGLNIWSCWWSHRLES